jgi:phosphoribosylanthranilate isomerase
MTVRVKICGITSERDAFAAAEAGADAVGFVFAGGPRAVTPEQARRIARRLPPFLHKVGVFADAPADRVRLVARACGLSWAQLHGGETRAWADALGVPWVKVFHVADGRVLARVRKFGAPLIHLDTQAGSARGGTGTAFDWAIARRAGELGRVILAGGLTPDNVARAVAEARPFAVDVCTGVEARPGRKDARKLRKFVEEARR